jgi:hypothetical protein
VRLRFYRIFLGLPPNSGFGSVGVGRHPYADPGYCYRVNCHFPSGEIFPGRPGLQGASEYYHDYGRLEPGVANERRSVIARVRKEFRWGYKLALVWLASPGPAYGLEHLGVFALDS